MENTLTSSGRALTDSNLFYFVSLITGYSINPKLTVPSFIPESPRFLVSKDRQEEAYHILVHYHAEGNLHSPFIRAEMAQIASTIRIELANSKRSWLEMFSTPGMRKRVLVGSCLGLFTQWSGNTLISYYFNDLFKMIGYQDPNFKSKMNVGWNGWNLVNAVLISLLVRRFPRRKMYLICATSCLCCYIGWTISMQRFLATKSALTAKITVFWIFMYSPCYNIGYNALTYSKLLAGVLSWMIGVSKHDLLTAS